VLIDDLRAAADDDWRAFTHHPFVAGIADGTLPEAAFRAYLVQDYRFLVHFARAHALEAYKAETIEDLRWAASAASLIIDEEMRLHIAYCAEWGITEAEMEATEEAPANVAYTRFVLDTGLAGDALDLAVALAPCTVGYGEIGARLAADPATVRGAGNPYEAWIAAYSGDAYQAGVTDAVERLESLGTRRGGAARLDDLVALFRRASRLETDFWQMGFDLAGVDASA
jgi:thiaminase/transcriptional activator TenA